MMIGDLAFQAAQRDVLRDQRKAIDLLMDSLIEALPYVESEIGNPAYKAGAVAKVVARMQAALVSGEQAQ